jgi:glycosyltransferase involved in cell wall biosynthesis
MGGKGGMPSMAETLKGHVRAGHEVVLILPEYNLFAEENSRFRPSADAPYETFLAACPWLPGVKRIRYVAKRLFGDGNATWLVSWILNRVVLVLLTLSLFDAVVRVRWRHQRQFELVYAHNQYAAITGYLVRLFYGIPNVTRLYGTFLADLMDKPLLWLRYTTSWVGYKTPHRLLICADDGTRGDDVARKLGIDLSKFRFWQNGVDRPEVDPSWSREGFAATAPANLRLDAAWIVACSRLTYWKRLDRILRGFQYCRKHCRNAQLLVAGDGPEREPLQAMARDLGVADDVVWLGGLAHADVWRLMHLADGFVIANDVTNRCNPVYEAIRAGTPIASIHDPSTADLLKDGSNALLAEADDAEGLGRCMLRLCTDTRLAERLRAAQRALSDTLWTWSERMKAETDELERLACGSLRGPTAEGEPAPVRNPARGV